MSLSNNMNSQGASLFEGFLSNSELKERIFFTISVLVIFRFLSFVPLPSIDIEMLAQTVGSADLFSFISSLTGGAFGRMSIISLSVFPYISASIIMQLMSATIPSLVELKKEGEAGKKKINFYTRIGTIILATLQGLSLVLTLLSSSGAIVDHGVLTTVVIVSTLTAGTLLLMWLGEQVSARGIGNGVSLIIFAGIVSGFPAMFDQVFSAGRESNSALFMLFFMVVSLAVVFLVCFFERAQRRLIVQYPQQTRGGMGAGRPTNSHLPLKINVSGVIPPIFASALLSLPLTFGLGSVGDEDGILSSIMYYFSQGSVFYYSIFGILIIFFSFFYTPIIFNSSDTADNLKKSGAYIPGIRPGVKTASYLDYVLTRLTFVAGVYLAFVCILPEYALSQYGIRSILGGTSILICVSVTMDTVQQIQSYLFAQKYESLMKKARIKRRS